MSVDPPPSAADVRVSTARTGVIGRNPESAAKTPLRSTMTCASVLWYTHTLPPTPTGTTALPATIWLARKLTLLAVGAMALTASTAVFAQDKGQIGIAMPTQSSLRWISDGNELNGITFYACGTETSVDHVQAHMGLDDGLEPHARSRQPAMFIGAEHGEDGAHGWRGDWGKVGHAASAPQRACALRRGQLPARHHHAPPVPGTTRGRHHVEHQRDDSR